MSRGYSNILLVTTCDRDFQSAFSHVAALLDVEDLSLGVTLDTRYYTSKVSVVCQHVSSFVQEKDNLCEESVVETASAVIIVALGDLENGRQVCTDLVPRFNDECTRLFIVNESLLSDPNNLNHVLKWSVDLRVEVISEVNCDYGMTVKSRLREALECAEWPVREFKLERSSTENTEAPIIFSEVPGTSEARKQSISTMHGNKMRRSLNIDGLNCIMNELVRLDDSQLDIDNFENEDS